MIVFKSLVFLFLTGLCLTRLKDKLISLLCLEVEESVGFRYSNAGQCYKLGKKCFFFFPQTNLSFLHRFSLSTLGAWCSMSPPSYSPALYWQWGSTSDRNLCQETAERYGEFLMFHLLNSQLVGCDVLSAIQIQLQYILIRRLSSSSWLLLPWGV